MDSRGDDYCPKPMGLWTPPAFGGLMRRSRRERTVTLASGERAKVTIEGTEQAGFVGQCETDERLDGVAMPVARYTIRRDSPEARAFANRYLGGRIP